MQSETAKIEQRVLRMLDSFSGGLTCAELRHELDIANDVLQPVLDGMKNKGSIKEVKNEGLTFLQVR